jgi:hypothetical protein
VPALPVLLNRAGIEWPVEVFRKTDAEQLRGADRDIDTTREIAKEDDSVKPNAQEIVYALVFIWAGGKHRQRGPKAVGDDEFFEKSPKYTVRAPRKVMAVYWVAAV